MNRVNIVTVTLADLAVRLGLPEGSVILMGRLPMEQLDSIDFVVDGVGPETVPGCKMARLPISDFDKVVTS